MHRSRQIGFLFLLVVTVTSSNFLWAQSSSVPPRVRLVATGGTISQASTSLASSLAVNEAKKSLQAEVPEEKFCQTFHSSELNEIFFETIDQSDCIYDPMSIYR